MQKPSTAPFAGLPLLVFVNKIDRLGARGEALLEEMRRKLGLRVVAMNAASGLGSRGAEVVPCDRADAAWREALVDVLAETDEGGIAEFERAGGEPSAAFLEAALRGQIASATPTPVWFGSAITGVGVAELLAGLTHGDGAWESRFAGYAPVSGEPPMRKRVGPDPLNRAHYLAEVARG